jgi:2-oxoglutarate dehydrogenase E2 component (dihydrolipoamide succinyltransferase)
MIDDAATRIPITIPALGVAMTEAVLTRWIKSPMDEVATGEPVAEIETDKISTDLLSPASGVLVNHLCEEGDIMPVGGVVAEVVTATEARDQKVPDDDK